MPIYDLTYRGWRGRQTRVPAWFPILENTIKLAFRNRILTNLYRACAIPPLITCVILYVRYQFESSLRGKQMPGQIARQFSFDMPRYFEFLFAQGIIAFAVAAVVGGQAIAADRRGNGLETIFSRAITRGHYILGRFLGLFTLVLGATLIPGFVIWICDLSFASHDYRLEQTLDYPLRITIWALLLSTSASLLILAFSAFIKRAWLAMAAFVAFLFISMTFSQGLGAAAQRVSPDAAEFIRGFSFFQAHYATQAWIFGVSRTEIHRNISDTSSIIFLTGLAALSLIVILRKVRPIEVVS